MFLLFYFTLLYSYRKGIFTCKIRRKKISKRKPNYFFFSFISNETRRKKKKEKMPIKRRRSSVKIDMNNIKETKYDGVFFSKDNKEEYPFIIVDHDDSAKRAVDFIRNELEPKQINLIISVTGGAGSFVLPSRVKTSFKEGISKIAESTNALIITGLIFG